MSTKHRPILVTGGTGTLGREVVRRLQEGKHQVRVLSRRPRAADDGTRTGGTPRLEWATGNLTTGEGLEAAVSGVGTVIHCATTGTRKDVEGTRHLVEAARKVSARKASDANGQAPHLVFISIVGVDRVPFSYYRTKLDAERVVQDSGLPWTILRTTQFHDLIARLIRVQRRLPVTLSFAGVPIQPIDTGEVADRLVELALSAPAGRVADMAGPEVRSARDLTQLTLRAYGRRRPVLPLPVPGKAGQGWRAGRHTAPDHAVGRITYTEYLQATTGRKPGFRH